MNIYKELSGLFNDERNRARIGVITARTLRGYMVEVHGEGVREYRANIDNFAIGATVLTEGNTIIRTLNPLPIITIDLS